MTNGHFEGDLDEGDEAADPQASLSLTTSSVGGGVLAWFAHVILPLPRSGAFTYRVPRTVDVEGGALTPGMRVLVPFGRGRVLTGVVDGLTDQPPAGYEAKLILEILDEEGAPSLTGLQRELFAWMSRYYLCSIGEATFAGLPTGLRLSSESRFQLNPDGIVRGSGTTGEEEAILKLLGERDSVSMDELLATIGSSGRGGAQTLSATIKRLIARRLVIAYEQVRERYAPRRVRVLQLNAPYRGQADEMEGLLTRLARAPKQLEALAAYLTLAPLQSTGDEVWVEKSRIIGAGASASALSRLVQMGIMTEREQTQSRIVTEELGMAPPALSEAQDRAAAALRLALRTHPAALLHGITGSGKTEVYVHLLYEALAGGGQGLLLLPEIALTTQIVERLRRVFGGRMAVYHSKFSDNERVEVWQGLQEGRFDLIVGVRSAVMLPFDRLALIVVDEEHESTYKQHEPAPRYHGRDTALMLGRLHKCPVLLGSATPSLESYHQAKTGQWGLVELMERYGQAQPPRLSAADLRTERARGTLEGAFTSELLGQIRQTLAKGEQVILFQNRRGYAPYVSCRQCAWVPECENCSVSLTLHRRAGQLRCHYCGYSEPVALECRQCHSTEVRPIGYGTEKLEDELERLIPGVGTLRMDQDTTRRKNALPEIIAEFAAGRAQILIGTQMVTKGLDFDKVTLVGIFDIDRLLNYPDFRAHERAFQTVVQVAGRAGRRQGGEGLVLIQTAVPQAPLLRYILEQDYAGFYAAEIAEREQFHYPPFTRLIRLTLRHAHPDQLAEPAQWLAARLRAALGQGFVLGPEPPLVERIRNEYLMEINLKLPRERTSFGQVKALITEALAAMPRFPGVGKLRVITDVDPY